MSPDDDGGRQSSGDDVAASVRVTTHSRGFEIHPTIGNYAQFEIAARLAFTIPDALDEGQFSPAAAEADRWEIDDDELVLIERLEWASSIERACSITTEDRAAVEALVDSATVEVTDMDGTRLTVLDDVDADLPPERRPAGQPSTGEAADAETDTPSADAPEQEPGDDGGSDDDGDAGPAAGSAAPETAPSQADAAAADTTERSEPQSTDDSDAADAGSAVIGDRSQRAAAFPPDLERRPDEAAESAGDDSPFEWAEVGNAADEAGGGAAEADADDATNASDETDRSETDSGSLVDRVRSLFTQS